MWIAALLLILGIGSYPVESATDVGNTHGNQSLSPSRPLKVLFSISAALAGVLLLVGGRDLRRNRERGRRVVLVAIWTLLVYVAVFSIGVGIQMLFAAGSPLVRTAMVGAALIGATVWGSVLRVQFRYFMALRVREATEPADAA